MADKIMGRLALRVEGPTWRAYCALPDTMAGAVELGSIALGAVESSPERKAAFIDLMKLIVTDLIEEKSGARPGWGGLRPAPEHERSGNA